MIGGQSGGRLVIADPSGSITRHDITADTIVLGRAPASDIVLSHAVVSSRHAQVSRANGQVTLTDLGSMNGTTVNGVRLAAVRPRTLQDGDRIAIGPFRLVYQSTASASPALPGQFTPYPGYPVPGGPGQSLPPGMSAMPGTRAQAVPGMPPGHLPGQPLGQTGNAPTRPASPPAGNVPQQLDLGAKTSLTFGRAPTNDIVLDHPQISRNHATLTRQGAELVLQDLGSTNGTYVNGAPITSAVLDRNDHIRIGPFDFVLAGATGSAPSLRADDGVRIDGIDLTTRVGKGTIILQSVSLTIFPREFVAVVGGSGWGKSTLVKALAGARPATSGTVLYNGLDLSSHFAAFRTSIGYVPQDDIIHRDLTVERALEYAARLRLPADTTAAERERRVQEVLHDLNLTPHRAKYIDDLSGGQRKRVSIGVELLTRPNLFFLDEPTSGLDPAGRKQTIELIRELSGRDRTIIIATHILSDVERVCSDVGIISQGRMIYSGPMADMRRLARQGTISVEIEGNATAFEQQVHTLDEIGSVRYERLGAEFRITFLGTEQLTEYLQRVLQLIDRTGVELLRVDTGSDEIEEAFLRRLEEDRTRGFLRASAWAATHELARLTGGAVSEDTDAGIPGHPAV